MFLKKKYPNQYSSEQLKNLGVADLPVESIGRTLRRLCKRNVIKKIKVKNVPGILYIYNKKFDKENKKY